VRSSRPTGPALVDQVKAARAPPRTASPITVHSGAPALDICVDLPLGTFPNGTRRTTTTDLPPCCFYTDGLIERRDRPSTTEYACYSSRRAGPKRNAG
jgi:hypothetical protein